eukprot:2334807-Prymnesium_polylepis.1
MYIVCYRQAPGAWYPRGQPASLSTGNRLRAREPPVDLRRRSRRTQDFRIRRPRSADTRRRSPR